MPTLMPTPTLARTARAFAASAGSSASAAASVSAATSVAEAGQVTAFWREFIGLTERYPFVHLDTTMAFTSFLERLAPYPAQLRPRLAAAADRILLGSDFPNIPYPYLPQLQALASPGLGADWLRAVCYDNAIRLLRL